MACRVSTGTSGERREFNVGNRQIRSHREITTEMACGHPACRLRALRVNHLKTGLMPRRIRDRVSHGLFMKNPFSHFVVGLVFSFSAITAGAQPLGDFRSQTDVGDPALAGSVIYDPDLQSYTVSGAGRNMWFDQDEFHFVWKRLKGDFILRTHAEFPGQGVDPHRKLGWMARSTLESGSPHINAVVHGDGLTSLQFRRAAGGITEEIRSTLTAADVIQLERKGNDFTMSVARFGQPFVRSELRDLALGEELYIGLFVCSHNPEVIEKAIFKNVRITVPAAEDFVPYRDYIGSRLETLDVDNGERTVLLNTREAIEAPNWTPDGTTLIYNSKGRLFRFSLAEQKSFPIDTGFATRCNNDHVLSFDGTMLGISHHAQEAGGRSVIYTLPVTGGIPRRVTVHAPSYLHGWSPDGKSLLFTGERQGEFDIYRIPVTGGEEIRLTTAKGLDDGPEYSPDGEWIYFNSARTGTMQLWRMKGDGSGQEQLTHDEFNDWFPHVSPDGRRIVFLSFSKEVAPDDHPYYKQVYLRMLPVDGGEPTIVAYVYGGQGTINVPSWAPDSRRLAFVSHTSQ
jgi:TolB protein